MKTPDTHNLEASYRRMTDSELFQLAADAESLTDAARGPLDAELHPRSLAPSLQGAMLAVP